MRAVMSLYEGAKTRVRAGIKLSKEYEVKGGVHQGSFLSIVVEVVMENMRNGLMSEML
mgnify:CR=1 FL=1